MKISERRKDLKDKSAGELNTELQALLREQFGLRMQRATQQLSNNAKLPAVRRDIARLKTVARSKHQGSAKSVSAKSSSTEAGSAKSRSAKSRPAKSRPAKSKPAKSRPAKSAAAKS